MKRQELSPPRHSLDTFETVSPVVLTGCNPDEDNFEFAGYDSAMYDTGNFFLFYAFVDVTMSCVCNKAIHQASHWPWSHIAKYFVINFPYRRAIQQFMTVVYWFSKAVHLIPFTSFHSAWKLKILILHVFQFNGIPRTPAVESMS